MERQQNQEQEQEGQEEQSEQAEGTENAEENEQQESGESGSDESENQQQAPAPQVTDDDIRLAGLYGISEEIARALGPELLLKQIDAFDQRATQRMTQQREEKKDDSANQKPKPKSIEFEPFKFELSEDEVRDPELHQGVQKLVSAFNDTVTKLIEQIDGHRQGLDSERSLRAAEDLDRRISRLPDESRKMFGDDSFYDIAMDSPEFQARQELFTTIQTLRQVSQNQGTRKTEKQLFDQAVRLMSSHGGNGAGGNGDVEDLKAKLRSRATQKLAPTNTRTQDGAGQTRGKAAAVAAAQKLVDAAKV